jgi:hypothetical protein
MCQEHRIKPGLGLAKLNSKRRWGIVWRSHAAFYREVTMVRKRFTLFCSLVILLSLTAAVQAPAQEKTHQRANEGRWEGNVIRSNPDRSTLTVRNLGSNIEMTIHYDGATRWVSQEHASKKVNNIDPTQVKDNDRVIAIGIWDKGVLYATLISKRLTHSY